MRSVKFGFVVGVLLFTALCWTARATGSDDVELVYLKAVDGVKLTGFPYRF